MFSHSLTLELLSCAKLTSASHNRAHQLENISQLCSSLAEEIQSQRYHPGEYTRFVVSDPKLREIYAPSYKDRLAQTWLARHIEPFVEKVLIEDSFSNRVGKGTLAAIRRVQHFMRQPNHTHYLQLDIQSYFNSIHLPILRKQCDALMRRYLQAHSYYPQLKHVLSQQIARNISLNDYRINGDRRLLSALPAHKILENAPHDTGLPLGSVVSQLLANLYLSPLDHFVKHHLRIQGYTRYMDDIFILGSSSRQLSNIKVKIDRFVQNELHLTLHPTKQRLQSIHQGADYLGYIVYPHHCHIRKRNIRKFHRWLAIFNACLDTTFPTPSGAIAPEWHRLIQMAPVIPSTSLIRQMQSIINSYLGILSHANHWRLRRDTYHAHMGALKAFFIPASAQYTSVRIKKPINLEWLRRQYGE